LQSSLNKFLEENFQKIQNIENNNQNIARLYSVFQIVCQEINNTRNDLTKAFTDQELKINRINEVNEKYSKFYEKWQDEDSKNIENISKVHEILNESNNKLVNEINCQSKKLDEPTTKNNLENDNIKMILKF